MGCGASSNGRSHAYLLTASSDGTARLWDGNAGAEVLRVDHEGGSVLGAELDLAGGRILTASTDGTARIWRARAAKPMPLIALEAGQVQQKNLDSSSEDNVPRAVEVLRVQHDDKKGGHVWAARLDQAGALLATAGRNELAKVWAVSTGAELCHATHEGSVNDVQIARAGGKKAETLLLTASEDGAARVWSGIDAARQHPPQSPPELRETLKLEHGGTAAVFCAVFNDARDRIATSSRDGTARIWDARTGSELLRLVHEESKPCPVRSVRFFRGGAKARVVTAADDMTARIWDMAGSELWRVTPSSPLSCASLVDGENAAEGLLLTACADGMVSLWTRDPGVQQILEVRHECSVQTAVLYRMSGPWLTD
eukprot:TRINITY_DN42515_c0_g1_i1.p1 TRINITY_DN42515_c0_g1~~TRINITY_DN42515_c0_g1_i1.p1  ORF type:complete len:382 (+),score=47.90 TRINITY_DN42515_c0_g1_i1:42-1148(+)